MASQALSAKVKELMKSNEDQMSISNLLLQKQNRNEMKCYINPGVKRS